jgi:hypothetical protein
MEFSSESITLSSNISSLNSPLNKKSFVAKTDNAEINQQSPRHP